MHKVVFTRVPRITSMTGMHELDSFHFLGKTEKNLKVESPSILCSKFLSWCQLKSSNAIKQIHISQLTNPTQKTFLGPD